MVLRKKLLPKERNAGIKSPKKGVVELPVVEDGFVREKKKQQKMSFWDKRRLKKKPDTSFLIKMFYSNGTCREFVISTSQETFDYKKRTYYLRKEDISFNLTQNQFELNYIDDYPVPITSREVVRQGKEAFWSITPENLKPIIKMNYVKALANSDEVSKWIKMTAGLMMMNFLFLVWIFTKVSKIFKVLVPTG